jgi:hypothetical protein
MIATGSSTAWLVFRGGYEYVFTHGDTMEFLAVMLSATAISLFDQYNVTADELAKQAAEWALLVRRTSRTVDLGPDADDFLQFCRYYFDTEALRKRAS